jgi:hypothetical protein
MLMNEEASNFVYVKKYFDKKHNHFHEKTEQKLRESISEQGTNNSDGYLEF